MGLVKDAVREDAGAESAAALEAAVPEAETWRQEGEAPPAGGLFDVTVGPCDGMDINKCVTVLGSEFEAEYPYTVGSSTFWSSVFCAISCQCRAGWVAVWDSMMSVWCWVF